MSRRSLVAVSATMSPGDRRAARAALASGARTVEMPAGSAVLHGETAHASDPHPFLGTVTFECSAGEVHAVRARPENSRGLLPSAGGARTYPVTFSGSADAATGCVRGTVASEVKRYNRIVVPLALVAGVLAGGRPVHRIHYGMRTRYRGTSSLTKRRR